METDKTTVRRSVALPSVLLEEAFAVSAREIRSNLNGLVKLALKEYVERRKALDFERQMEEMAQDPFIQKSCQEIQADFRQTEMDGL